MGLETFALINDKDQVINHIVVDKESSDFEEIMVGQLTHWGCVRYVETFNEPIILDPSPEIWTTHTEAEGFVFPTFDATHIPEIKEIEKSGLPADSLLLEENADKRPEGWQFPSNYKLV